jgi:hypothetical protein
VKTRTAIWSTGRQPFDSVAGGGAETGGLLFSMVPTLLWRHA